MGTVKEVKPEYLIEQYMSFNVTTGRCSERPFKVYIVNAMKEYSSLQNAELKKENERLRNDLLDALDLKQGNGPTALSMVKAENSRLREALTNCRQMILWHLEHSEPQHDDYSAAFLNNSKWAVDKAGQALNPSTK